MIYYLRKIPLLKRIIPAHLYGNDEINNVVHVLGYLIRGVSALFIQAVFLLVCIIMPGVNRGWTQTNNMMFFVFFMTLFAAFFNTPLFSVSTRTYYAVTLLRVDANQYAILELTKLFIKKGILSFFIFLICGFMGYDWYYCILYPIFYISCKTIVGFILVKLYDRKGVLYYDKWYFTTGAIVLMFVSIALSIFVKSRWGIYISDIYFIILAILSLPITYWCYQQLLKTQSFKHIYKEKLVWEKLILKDDDEVERLKKSAANSFQFEANVDASKKGFAYLNSVFFTRHKKILLTSAKKLALGYIGAVVVIVIVLNIWPEFKINVYEVINLQATSVLAVMYYTNRGSKIVQAMFVNCDRSMLRYRFYREPATILALFIQRLKTVAYVNLIPSLAISIGLCVVFAISAPVIEWYYLGLIFIAINGLSLFFSVHHLVLYYLLQPYDETLQARGHLYNFIHYGAYVLCYQAFRIQVGLSLFTILTTLFCIVYICVALLLVFRFAPKTFKIRH